MICLVAFVVANLFYLKSGWISLLFFNYLKLLVVDNVGLFMMAEKYGNSNPMYSTWTWTAASQWDASRNMMCQF